jgi:hypothetical protein
MGLLYDNLNSFGLRTATGTFTNILNLGPNSSVERMTVDFHANLTAGSSIYFFIDMAPDNNGTPGAWDSVVSTISSGGFSFADLNKQVFQLPVPVTIPKYKYQYIQVRVSGSALAGPIEAVLNTYLGK